MSAIGPRVVRRNDVALSYVSTEVLRKRLVGELPQGLASPLQAGVMSFPQPEDVLARGRDLGHRLDQKLGGVWVKRLPDLWPICYRSAIALPLAAYTGDSPADWAEALAQAVLDPGRGRRLYHSNSTQTSGELRRNSDQFDNWLTFLQRLFRVQRTDPHWLDLTLPDGSLALWLAHAAAQDPAPTTTQVQPLGSPLADAGSDRPSHAPWLCPWDAAIEFRLQMAYARCGILCAGSAVVRLDPLLFSQPLTPDFAQNPLGASPEPILPWDEALRPLRPWILGLIDWFDGIHAAQMLAPNAHPVAHPVAQSATSQGQTGASPLPPAQPYSQPYPPAKALAQLDRFLLGFEQVQNHVPSQLLWGESGSKSRGESLREPDSGGPPPGLGPLYLRRWAYRTLLDITQTHLHIVLEDWGGQRGLSVRWEEF